MVRAVVTHPGLWAEAFRTWLAMSRPGWWRRFPFLPWPDRGYVRWRIATAYGTPAAPVRPADVVAFLEWRRRMRAS
jgi:hypothetical protein